MSAVRCSNFTCNNIEYDIEGNSFCLYDSDTLTIFEPCSKQIIENEYLITYLENGSKYFETIRALTSTGAIHKLLATNPRIIVIDIERYTDTY